MQTRNLTPLASLALLLALTAPLAAQDCEVPLFVQQGTVDANVMILFDNSGSMNEVMFHPDFDRYTVYPGPFVSERMYYISSDGDYGPRNVPGRPSAANQTTPTVRMISGFHQQSRYVGNYLNWLFYNATDEQRAWTITNSTTRMHVAHEVVRDIIQRSERVRFGLAIFNYDNGGRIIAECGTSEADLVNTVMNIEGDSWTPLGESMEDVLDYFKGNHSPIMAECQKNFCIVITDGFPTKDRSLSGYLLDADNDGRDPGSCTSIGSPDPDSSDCSDNLDDVAYYMYHNDLSGDFVGDQTVVTYTIGFGLDASILQDTADNGDGLYFLANNAVDLWTSLELVMLDIISRISTGAAVAVVSTERGYEERLYRGKFMPGSWHGYLESFDLPYENGDSPVWEAGYILSGRAPNTRSIITGIGSTDLMFDVGNAATLMGPMGIAHVDDATDVIRWTRGEAVAGLRNRGGWRLGDIIHSTPVVVGAPANFNPEPAYQSFMAANEIRTKMVYAGANDGMLHAFFAANGEEAWAFVPEFALPKLAAVADTSYCHQYTVDLTPSVTDCKLGGLWRTVLIGGGRQGGASYFALDVTDPYWPDLLWQVELPHGKPFASEVEFAVIDGTTVALIGSGLDEVDGIASLEAYDVADGTHLGSITLSSNASRRNRSTGVTAVDYDLDGEDDFCYVADLQGHLWRFDFDGSDNPAHWDRLMLWNSDHDEITATPTAAYGENGEVYVYVGTGAYLTEDDIHTRDDHRFVCIIDRQDGRDDLHPTDQTGSDDVLIDADGWYVNLEQAEGERVTETAVVVAGAVFFTTYVPSSELCSAGGVSWLYRLDYANGIVPDDGESDDWNGDAMIVLGDGIASRPVVDVVNETVIVQSSDATILVEDIGQTYFHLTVRAWQENFDYVSVPPDSN
ncbi:MAG: PilC/PilY family type IV pilus protein [Candidatus Krumholzibacteriia bacterium]